MPSRILNPEHEYDVAVDHNLGLGQLFYDQVQTSPDVVAVVDEGVAVTYGQLNSQASCLAQQLSNWTLNNEERVGIVVQHGVANVVAQMAVVYAGSSCVPIDPTLPDHQIQQRLTRLDARCVLTDQANRHRDLPFPVVCIDDFSAAESTAEYQVYPIATSLEHCTHIIHTSGTTNEPKAVRIAARSILHVVFHAPFEPVHATDVVAHVNNSSFDVSLFDVWAPLLRGARIAVLSKAVLLDLPLLAREIHRLGITVMATTTALLNLAAFTYAQAFAKLRICIMGGEAANLAAIEIILHEGPPEMLVNAYGPTECCIFCLAKRVTLKDVQDGTISIGMPLGRTVAYIADDAGQPSDEGELWIGGPGVSPGYVNQPDKTAAAFTKVAGLGTITADAARLYRTGDIVRRCPDGQMDYIGRRDHQVKIRGFRIELGAVEAALLRTGLFAEAVAMKIELPQKGAGSILGAYAVPADTSNPPTIDGAVKLVRAIVPDYMVPQLELISQMPLNNHVKVDRKRLQELFSQRWNNTSPPESSKDVCSTLAGLWAAILASPVAVAVADQDDNDFFRLGGTSLQASLLISQIRRTYDVEISLLTLYDNSTLGALSSVIIECLNGRVATLRDERDAWRADSMIADDLPSPSGPVVDWRRDTEGRVFLTGSTGFVGTFLLADLLHMPGVVQVGCLVRASDATAGQERLRAAMAKYGLWEECFAHKLLAVPGSLEDKHLGMGTERFEELAHWASVVFHLGAHVNYTQPYSMHQPANTLGTRHVVGFACTGRVKPIHYVSSISCFGPTGSITGATLVREDEPLLPHLIALPYDHGYAQSQWVVEQLMRRLMDRGFPIAIYRPGFITGHSQTGACNPDDFLCRLIHACLEMRCYPQLPNQRKEFVPVDYCCAAILHIAASSTSIGRAYHIVPPTRAVSIDMNNSMDLVGQAGDSPMQGVSYAEWIERLTAISPQRLLPLQPMLAEKVLDGRTRWELYENMPVYETTNTVKALADYPGGLEFPVLGVSLMKKYLGFLRARK
jgi:L-tyrosine reductase